METSKSSRPNGQHRKDMRSRDVTTGTKRWIILIGLFFVSFLENGIVRSFALILEDLTREFEVSAAYIGSVLGLVFGVCYWLAFVNIPLLRHFTVRQLVVFGSTVATAGLVASSWARTASHLSAALSAYGIGNLFVIMPTNTCPRDYFPDQITIATGIMLSGGSAGVIVMPWIFENLLDNYGWRGSILIVGGLFAHLVILGAILQPTEVQEKSGDITHKSQGESRKNVNENCPSENIPRYSFALELNECNGLSSEDHHSRVPIYQDKERTGTEFFPMISTPVRFFKEHPRMLIVMIQFLLHAMTYNGWLLYLIPNALAKGFTRQQAVQISIAGGVCDFLGRSGIGFVWSRKFIRFDLWYSLMYLFLAAAFWTNFIADSFAFLMALSACYGLLIGALIPTQFTLTLRIVGQRNYKSGSTVLFVAFGVSGLVTGSLFGGLFDISESYEIPFGVIAVLNITVALLNLSPLCYSKFFCKRKEKKGHDFQESQ